jgi:hypothetical protein
LYQQWCEARIARAGPKPSCVPSPAGDSTFSHRLLQLAQPASGHSMCAIMNVLVEQAFGQVRCWADTRGEYLSSVAGGTTAWFVT